MFHRKLYFAVAMTVAVATSLASPVSAAEPAVWTLESAARRALEIAPELRAARAEVAAREGTWREADAWPNPTVGLSRSDKLGLEDGAGGTDLTQLEIRQPLPLRRLSRERTVAAAGIEGARERTRLERLKLEREAARAYHRLQLAQARRRLAEERVDLADKSVVARDRLVRYLAPAERERLAVLREQARLGLFGAQAEEERAAIAFRTRLALPPQTAVEVALLALPAVPPGLDALEKNIETHPALAAAQRDTEAAQAGIAAAESRRFGDPELALFRERDFINGSRRNVAGIGLSVQVPLWNTNPGPVQRARAEAMAAQTRAQMAQRDARASLASAYAQLVRLREQAVRAEGQMLAPAGRVLALTRRGFEAGEVNVLAFVDALNTWAEAGARSRELLAESAEAAAELRLTAGQPLLPEQEVQP